MPSPPTDADVTLLFFAKARELVGAPQASVSVPAECSGAQLRDYLVQVYPQLAILQDTFIVAVNQQYLEASESVTFRRGDEVAIIPPISGVFPTMDILHLTAEPLSLEAISREVGSDDCGAISTFSGTTRNSFEDRQVVRLEYEAYEEMALSEMKKICAALREKWSLKHIAIYHRLGVVPVGESSVVIAISSCHRRDSLEAVSHAIDALKARVPVWKREVYGEGEGADQWKQNAECHWLKKTSGS